MPELSETANLQSGLAMSWYCLLSWYEFLEMNECLTVMGMSRFKRDTCELSNAAWRFWKRARAQQG
eukprot:1159510-Pelagomonas_calceolata.AAC.4